MGNSETIICKYCGAEISTNVKKCKFCGEWIIEDTDNQIPKEIQHFNWGAFLMNWIWGIMHKKYITLLYFPACLIPVIGPLAISIWFGFAGNKWAWASKEWTNTKDFNETQKFWVRLWFVLTSLGIIISLKIFILLLLISNVEL